MASYGEEGDRDGDGDEFALPPSAATTLRWRNDAALSPAAREIIQPARAGLPPLLASFPLPLAPYRLALNVSRDSPSGGVPVVLEPWATAQQRIVDSLIRRYGSIHDEATFQMTIVMPLLGAHHVELESAGLPAPSPGADHVIIRPVNFRQDLGPREWDGFPAVQRWREVKLEAANEAAARAKAKAGGADAADAMARAEGEGERNGTGKDNKAEKAKAEAALRETSDPRIPSSTSRAHTADGGAPSTTAQTGRSTGGTLPDVGILAVIGTDVRVGLLSELKWVSPGRPPEPGPTPKGPMAPPRTPAPRPAIALDGRDTGLDSAHLAFALRECFYQTAWYLHGAGCVKDTRLAVAQVNEFFVRFVRLADGTLVFDGPPNHVSGNMPSSSAGVGAAAAARPTLTVAAIDADRSVWEPLPRMLIRAAQVNQPGETSPAGACDRDALAQLSLVIYTALLLIATLSTPPAASLAPPRLSPIPTVDTSPAAVFGADHPHTTRSLALGGRDDLAAVDVHLLRESWAKKKANRKKTLASHAATTLAVAAHPDPDDALVKLEPSPETPAATAPAPAVQPSHGHPSPLTREPSSADPGDSPTSARATAGSKGKDKRTSRRRKARLSASTTSPTTPTSPTSPVVKRARRRSRSSSPDRARRLPLPSLRPGPSLRSGPKPGAGAAGVGGEAGGAGASRGKAGRTHSTRDGARDAGLEEREHVPANVKASGTPSPRGGGRPSQPAPESPGLGGESLFFGREELARAGVRFLPVAPAEMDTLLRFIATDALRHREGKYVATDALALGLAVPPDLVSWYPLALRPAPSSTRSPASPPALASPSVMPPDQPVIGSHARPAPPRALLSTSTPAWTPQPRFRPVPPVPAQARASAPPAPPAPTPKPKPEKKLKSPARPDPLRGPQPGPPRFVSP